MSGGGQSGSQNQSSQQSGSQSGSTSSSGTSTSTVNPTANWQTGNNNLFGSVGSNGLTSQQQMGSDLLTGRLTNDDSENAILGLNPQISAITGGAIPTVGTSSVGTGTVGTSAVNASSVASQAQPYENQYANDVLNPSLAAFDQGVANNNNAIRASRDAGSAFGDRAAVADSVTDAQNATARGALAGQITGTGYQTALTAGAQDAGNLLTASGQNAGNTLAASNANAANTLSASGQNAANTLGASGTNAANYLTGVGQQLAGNAQQGSNLLTASNMGLGDIEALSNIGQGGVGNLISMLGSQVPAFGGSTSTNGTGSTSGDYSGSGYGSGGSSSKGASIPFL